MKKAILLLLTCFLIGPFVNAQVELHNGGILYLSNSTDTLFINGNFTNTSAAALGNNGKLYIKQNLVNDQASMAAGAGTLFLNGATAQTVSGTQVFKTYDLVTANPAGMTLNNDLSVAGTHIFSSGMITTSATPNYMIYEAGSSYSGSADDRHVIGWVRKTGNTDFGFPVGNNEYQRTIALTNLTATAQFNVKYNRAVTPNYNSLFDPLVLVDTAEYWTINKISGSAARVVMNWDNSKVPFPNVQMSGTRVASYDGIFWKSIGGTGTGSALTTGTVVSNSVTVFNNNFTFGSVSYVLPVSILDFAATRVNNYTKLSWTIANEINVDDYELQRSDNGISYYTIFGHTANNGGNTAFYGYEDHKHVKGIVYYRLKINNHSTRTDYSKIVKVSENGGGKDLYVINNPVDTDIDIYAGDQVKGLYNYAITGISGQLMQAGSLDIKNEGVHTIHLKTFFARGLYILVIKNEMHKLQKTIFKN